MKKTTIKNTVTGKEMTFEISEGLEDMNAKRFNELKKYIIQVETGTDIPSLKNAFVKISNQFDKGSASGMYRELYNFIFSLQQLEAKEDPDQMCFALMTLEDGENPAIVDDTKLKDKINRMVECGLTQGMVREEVANFLSALIRL